MKRTTDNAFEGRRDGRKAFLAYVDPEIIKSLKVSAVERDVPAYELVEIALKEWLNKNSKTK